MRTTKQNKETLAHQSEVRPLLSNKSPNHMTHTNPAKLSSTNLLQLQQTIGNRKVAQLLKAQAANGREVIQRTVEKGLSKGTAVVINDGKIQTNIYSEQENTGYKVYPFNKIFGYDELTPLSDTDMSNVPFPSTSKDHPEMGTLIYANMKMREMVKQYEDAPETVFNPNAKTSGVSYSIGPASSSSPGQVSKECASVYAKIIGDHPFDNGNGRSAMFAIYSKYYESGLKLMNDPLELYALTTALCEGLQLDLNEEKHKNNFVAFFENQITEYFDVEELTEEEKTAEAKTKYFEEIIKDITKVSEFRKDKNADKKKQEEFEENKEFYAGQYKEFHKDHEEEE